LTGGEGVWRWLPTAIILLNLTIFGATVWTVTLHLRGKIRQQIASRDGEIFQAVTALDAETAKGEPSPLGLEDPTEQMAMLLRTSRLRGVVAARLFTPQGKPVIAFPVYVQPGIISAALLDQLSPGKAIAQFQPAALAQDHFLPDLMPPETLRLPTPLLEVTLPLRPKNSRKMVGVAQLVIDGRSIAAEYEELDRHLTNQAILAFGAGAILIASSMLWAFGRLRRSLRQLQERTHSLQRANQELALAAKTTAVGAVTAHLIHGLKSPLYGLYSLMSTQAGRPNQTTQTEWAAALATTRQLQTMVDEVAHLLRNEHELNRTESDVRQVLDMAQARVAAAAQASQVDCVTSINLSARLSNRQSSLVVLILENLLRNAIQASRPGSHVTISAERQGAELHLEVTDQGSGIPAERVAQLFLPGFSSKLNGLGIGLAISRQLAIHLEGHLELKRNSKAGCCFVLVLPIGQPPLSGQAGV
jgi:signal transduction histidine kinase